MRKIPFEQVEIQLLKIYNNFIETDPDKIEEICELAIAFIEASGWTINDYLIELFNKRDYNKS